MAQRIEEIEWKGEYFEVTFDFVPGDPGRYGGPPDSWCEPTGPEYSISRVKLILDSRSGEKYDLSDWIHSMDLSLSLEDRLHELDLQRPDLCSSERDHED